MRCWVFAADASAPCVPVHRYAQIWPQIFTNLWCTQHSALNCSSFPFLPNHRCRLYPNTLHYCADHTRRFDPFVHLVWNGSTVQTNLQLAICRFPNLLRSFPSNLPCDQHSDMPTGSASKPKCRGRPYWTLARPQSTCSGWDGCSSQQQSSILGSSFALPPAGFLQTDARVHHTVTQDSPSRGAVTGHSQSQVHTHSRRQQNSGVKELLQNNPGENNI